MSPITTLTTTTQVPVGEIHCQQNPYSRELQTTCIDCSEKPDKKGFYQVKLHDTVLFPEGGGQPYDTGFIDDIQVYNVQRKKLEHIHYTKQPVPVGKQVVVKLDWERRWDHMQQHSGQHLLTAVLEQEPYSVDTGSWNLGATKCYIELQTGEKMKQRMPTPEELIQVEKRVNQLILDALPITVHTESFNDETNKPDSLPDDYVGGGTIRRVEIKNLDMNPCCGTHVAHTGHLQSIKLLHTEKARGGNTRLFFLVGQRVTDTLDASLNVSRQLNNLLSVPQEAFVENVTRLQQARSMSQKTVKRLVGELASYIVADMGRRFKQDDVVMLYREDADMEFLQAISLAIREQNILDESVGSKVVVLAGGEKHLGGPMMIVASNDAALQQVAKTATAALDIKGGGKGRWQGKAKNWKGIDELQKQLDQLKISA